MSWGSVFSWRRFAAWFGVTLAVVWTVLFVLAAVDQAHNGSALDGGPLSTGALVATFWLPFVGVPIALIAAAGAGLGRRWIDRRQAPAAG